MRVIAGKARGMRLECPLGEDVRPMPSMARQGLFNILMHKVEGSTVLDLFAGAGTFGIEALSRGAAWCVFVERSPKVRHFLERNLTHTRLAEFCDVLQRDALHCGEAATKTGRRFDIVFAGPPFPLLADPRQKNDLAALLDRLDEFNLLREECIVIVQHEKQHSMPEGSLHLQMCDRRSYGRNVFTFYKAIRETDSVLNGR